MRLPSSLLLLLLVGSLQAKELLPNPSPPTERAVQVTEQAQPSLVTITQLGRKNEQEALGSGFIISEDGWIATNQHVIGQSRQLKVRLHDGSTHEVSSIIATDPNYDLAIIQIPKKGLKALPLGDSNQLKQGQQIVALGNPHGVGHSVVQGVISAFREIDEVSMLQIAMPIEEGNSGGPVLDMTGNVQGIVTLKSAITENLGFAHLVSDLKKLMAQPNPIPIKNWLTIGQLDSDQWNTLEPHLWAQSAGMIRTTTSSRDAGGRSLCLQKNASEKDLEFSTQVKLSDERGAAGLAFFSDGGDRHYGFYPSAGELRLVRFDGPDVYSWNILKSAASKAYRPAQWNTLKVQIQGERILCFVNDQKVFEVSDATYRQGTSGLCKFRKTDASFKKFYSSSRHSNTTIPIAKVQEIEKQLNVYFDDTLSEDELIQSLSENDADTERILDENHLALETRITKLKNLRIKLHEAKALRGLVDILNRPETSNTPPKLLEASLQLAFYDNPDVEVEHYLKRVQLMANEIQSALPKDANVEQKTQKLISYLFQEHGFHGSRSEDINDLSNSYLNEVLEDREGIPVSLSILFLDLAQRIGLHQVYGVSLPGRFMVASKIEETETAPEKITYIDVYNQGKTYTDRKLESLIYQLTGQVLQPVHLQPTSDREIIIRVLNNFITFSQSSEQVLRYLDLVLALNPEAPQERMQRALLCLKLGQTSKAKQDIAILLEASPATMDLDRLRRLYRSL